MNHRPTDPHDELARILEVVDGPRALPPGAEERLLREVLATASEPHAAASPARVRTRVRRRVAARPGPVAPARLALVAVAVVATVAVAVGVVRVLSEPASPTILPAPPPAALDTIDDPALCNRASRLVAALRLDGPDGQDGRDDRDQRGDLDPEPILELATVLDEFARRADEGASSSTDQVYGVAERASTAAAVLRLQARQLQDDDPEAAARAGVRGADLLFGEPSLLQALGCD